MNKFNDYRYAILPDKNHRGWIYRVYNFNGTILLDESKELFPHEGTARYAAIGQISLFEAKSA